MKQGKDAAEFLKPLLPYAASLWAVAEPDQHLALSPPEVIAASGGVARRRRHGGRGFGQAGGGGGGPRRRGS